MQHNLANFNNFRILIVGDVMLDRYWWGDVNRISPEAPVPIVRLQGSTVAPGGAANVAANVAGLGAVPILLGAIGSDDESRELERALGSLGIDPNYLIRLNGRPTIVKTRIVAHGQQVVRVDQEERLLLTPKEEEIILEAVNAVIESVNLVVISDYGKGFLSNSVLREIISRSKELGKNVLVDPKGRDYEKYRDSTLITPNRREAAQASGIDEEFEGLIDAAGPSLQNRHGLNNVLITQGENGMTLFTADEDRFHIPAASVETYDVTGAGDTVIATLAVAIAAGLGLKESAVIANAAAGEVVQHVGTTSITREMLQTALDRN
jgi:rfaE bifunctional protein kinase chain/domain